MQIMDQLNHCENWCLSGGADGADLLWGNSAKAAGHGVIHFSFDGARSKAAPEQLVRLNPDLLRQADEHCHHANTHLRRRYPPRSMHTRNLLRRDYYQIESAQSVYAISDFEADGQVAGGTAWAVMMFLIKHNFAPCNAFVFDQEACFWTHWQESGWQRIYEPPKPSGIYAGIGRRKINLIGRLAIAVLMDYDLRREAV